MYLTFVYCVVTVKYILKLFHLLVALPFVYEIWQNSDGEDKFAARKYKQRTIRRL